MATCERHLCFSYRRVKTSAMKKAKRLFLTKFLWKMYLPVTDKKELIKHLSYLQFTMTRTWWNHPCSSFKGRAQQRALFPGGGGETMKKSEWCIDPRKKTMQHCLLQQVTATSSCLLYCPQEFTSVQSEHQTFIFICLFHQNLRVLYSTEIVRRKKNILIRNMPRSVPALFLAPLR